MKILRWDTKEIIFELECSCWEELLKGALKAKISFYKADLTGADLRGADLTGVYLRGADLTGADLRGADLTGAYLRGADLTGAYLRGAYLTGAYLTGAYLRGADLTGAYLRGADLTGADLNNSKILQVYSFDRLYKYRSSAIVTEKEVIIIMGCFSRTEEEWKKDFWNNNEEFPKDSTAGKLRLKAFNKKMTLLGLEALEA